MVRSQGRDVIHPELSLENGARVTSETEPESPVLAQKTPGELGIRTKLPITPSGGPKEYGADEVEDEGESTQGDGELHLPLQASTTWSGMEEVFGAREAPKRRARRTQHRDFSADDLPTGAAAFIRPPEAAPPEAAPPETADPVTPGYSGQSGNTPASLAPEADPEAQSTFTARAPEGSVPPPTTAAVAESTSTSRSAKAPAAGAPARAQTPLGAGRNVNLGQSIRKATRRRRMGIALLVLLALTLTAGVLVQGHRTNWGRGSANSAATSAMPANNEAVLWAAANLADDSHISADPEIAEILRTNGFTAVTTVSPTDQSWGNYLILGPNGRSIISTQPKAPNLATASALLATFGQDGSKVEIRQHFTEPTSVAQLRAADLNRRIAGGQSLAANPALTATTATKASLLAGAVDVRATAALAQLLSSGPVTLDALTPLPSEQVAGMPIRTISVTPRNAAAFASGLQALPEKLGPASVQHHGGESQLTWTASFAPAL